MNRLIQMKAGEAFKRGDVGYYHTETGGVVKFVENDVSRVDIAIATKKCSTNEIIPWSRTGGLTKIGMPSTGNAGSPLYLDVQKSVLAAIEPAEAARVGIIVRRGVGLIDIVDD